jgi:UDP-N-acetylenolpyruvoylglucosamine reductase
MKSYSHSFVHRSVLTNLGVALVFTMFLITNADGQDAAARKALVETVRQDVVKKMGTKLAPGSNITAEGPDAPQ